MSEGGDIQGYPRRSSIQFSNLMFEKNVKLAAVDPQQQAKYNYYINRMKDPNINLQSLVRALDGDISFTDVTGRVVLSQTIANPLNDFSIDLSSMKNGVYWVTLINNSNSSIQKLVID